MIKQKLFLLNLDLFLFKLFSLDNNCELCNRNVELTFHHLIPKKNHKIGYIKKKYSHLDLNRYGINVCKDCHKMIHKLFSHKTLALEYYTKKRLLGHPKLNRFILWVKNQTKKVK